MSIEALLAPLPRSVLIEAAYFVIQTIRHRVYVDSLFNISLLTFSKDGLRIASQILAIIEEQEGRRFEELSKERADYYIAMLADIVQQRSVEDLQYDRNRGQKILNELRRSTAS